jgi:tetrahydromethanopterin S-methyltransferase subunit E
MVFVGFDILSIIIISHFYYGVRPVCLPFQLSLLSLLATVSVRPVCHPFDYYHYGNEFELNSFDMMGKKQTPLPGYY